MKETSPFTPGIPVDPQYFAGRRAEISRIERSLSQVNSGRNENIFLTGERGIGKTSLAALARRYAEGSHFVGAHCFLGPARTLEDACKLIIRGLLRNTGDKGITDKIKSILGNLVEKIELSVVGIGFNVEFKKGKETERLPSNFLQILDQLWKVFSETGKKGLFLILDDLNGVTKISEFAHFIKSTVDEIATRERKLPILLMLVGPGDRMTELAKAQPSVARIFGVVNLTKLSNAEASQFFQDAFSSVGIKIKESALDLMVQYSGGLPVLLHEVGDAVFWKDEDSIVDDEDAQGGIATAADSIGRKYIDRQLYQEIRSRTYRSIYYKLSEISFGLQDGIMVRKEVKKDNRLSKVERNNLDNFFRRMESLGLLNRAGPGEYAFANHLYALYGLMEAFAKEGNSAAKKEKEGDEGGEGK